MAKDITEKLKKTTSYSQPEQLDTGQLGYIGSKFANAMIAVTIYVSIVYLVVKQLRKD